MAEVGVDGARDFRAPSEGAVVASVVVLGRTAGVEFQAQGTVVGEGVDGATGEGWGNYVREKRRRSSRENVREVVV